MIAAGVVFALGLILFGALTKSRHAGKQALERELALLKSGAKSLDWRDLVEPFPESTNNGARVLLSASIVTDNRAKLRRWVPTPGVMIGPGVFYRRVHLEEWNNYDWVDHTTYPISWEFYESIIQSNANAIAKYHEALAFPKLRFDPNCAGYPMNAVGYLSPIKRAAEWLSAESLLNLRRGDHEAVHRNILEVMRLADAISENRVLIDVLVANAIRHTAFYSLVEAYQLVDWNDAQWLEIQQVFSNSEWREHFLETLEMERALNGSYLMRIRNKSSKLDPMLVSWVTPVWWDDFSESISDSLWSASDTLGSLWSDGMGETRIWWEEGPFAKFYSYAWLDRDVSNYFQQQRLAIAEFRTFTNGPVITDMINDTTREHSDEARSPYTERVSNPISQALDINSAHWKMLTRFLIEEHRNQLAMTACAIKRYDLVNNGTSPSTLESLVPDYLDTVPTDPGDGLPLRYSLAADGDWKLYSIGTDGIDDKGDGSPRIGNGFYYSQAHDFLWPIPASTSQIADYEKKQIEALQNSSR